MQNTVTTNTPGIVNNWSALLYLVLAKLLLIMQLLAYSHERAAVAVSVSVCVCMVQS